MKKILLQAIFLAFSIYGFSQHRIQASIQKGANDNQVNITYLPNYTCPGNEYLIYISFGLAIDTSYVAGLNVDCEMVGPYSSMSMDQCNTYIVGNEKIWIFLKASFGSYMSYTNGTPFTGAVLTFTGGIEDSAKIRVIDHTNRDGGPEGCTYFEVINGGQGFADLTNYSDMFYTIAGINGSTKGTYGNGDQYAETKLKINMSGDAQRSATPSKIEKSRIPQEITIGRIFPNPSKMSATLTIYSPEKDRLTIMISDINGRVVRQSITITEKGQNQIPINLAGLANNTYLINITSNKSGRVMVTKFIKQ